MAGQTWFMGYWAEQYVLYPPESVNVALYVDTGFLAIDSSFLRSYLTAYGLLLLAGVIAYGTGSTVYIFGTVRASRSIHGKLIEAILGTTLRCVSRCSYQVWWMMSPTSKVVRHDPYVSSDYSCYSRYSRPYVLPFSLPVHGLNVTTLLSSGWPNISCLRMA